MTWLQNIMKRSSSRRRQSKSPPSDQAPNNSRTLFGSKKRRTLGKDASYTEGESMCSEESIGKSSPAWRVENIRCAPPAEEEWWEDVDGCESEEDYGLECSYDEDDFSRERYATIESVRSGPSSQFHNCGFETWTKSREEWKKRTVETLPPRPTPAEYNQLVKGLTRNSAVRTYELPRRMALSDLIDVYTDIWDGQGA